MADPTPVGDKGAVKRSILQLKRDVGSIISLEEVKALNPETEDSEFTAAIKELEKEGMISKLDEETLQVNM